MFKRLPVLTRFLGATKTHLGLWVKAFHCVECVVLTQGFPLLVRGVLHGFRWRFHNACHGFSDCDLQGRIFFSRESILGSSLLKMVCYAYWY